MRKMKLGILLVLAIISLISVASAGFPSAVNGIPTYPGSNSYWSVQLLLPGVTPELPAASGYTSWCTDADPNNPHYLRSGTVYGFTAYSSLDGGWPADMPGVSSWNKVNYILNHKHADWRITQAAIWHFDGQSTATHPKADIVCPDTACSGGYKTGLATTPGTYEAYIKDTEDNGGSFNPDCTNYPKYAVVLYQPGKQVIIVEDDFTCPPVPEFPTLALPVAMLVGLVGTAQYFKSQKE
jgi:hypothetical protein